MGRIGALHRRAEFQAVYEKGHSWTAPPLVMKTLPNSTGASRLGLSVGKSIGKAVVRNRVRRRLREIVRQMPLKPGWDIVIVARPDSADSDFQKLRAAVEKLLYKARLITREE
ncbi:MAG: ribonuclease P protein component [Chloroflexota bacterium]